MKRSVTRTPGHLAVLTALVAALAIPASGYSSSQAVAISHVGGGGGVQMNPGDSGSSGGGGSGGTTGH